MIFPPVICIWVWPQSAATNRIPIQIHLGEFGSLFAPWILNQLYNIFFFAIEATTVNKLLKQNPIHRLSLWMVYAWVCLVQVNNRYIKKRRYMCKCRDIVENVLENNMERLEKVNVNGEYDSSSAQSVIVCMRYANSEQHMNNNKNVPRRNWKITKAESWSVT